jgi:hypothetical protein
MAPGFCDLELAKAAPAGNAETAITPAVARATNPAKDEHRDIRITHKVSPGPTRRNTKVLADTPRGHQPGRAPAMPLYFGWGILTALGQACSGSAADADSQVLMSIVTLKRDAEQPKI